MIKMKTFGAAKIIVIVLTIQTTSIYSGIIDTIHNQVSHIAEGILSITNIPKMQLRAQFASSPHQGHPSSTQIGQISPNEAQVISERKKLNNKALSKISNITNLPVNKTLNVAICTSGGGYRAMIATLTFLRELEKNNLLDSIQYAAALSGSAWAVGYWISSKKSLSDFISQVRSNLEKNSKTVAPITNTDAIIDVSKNFVRKFAYNQPLSSVDLWGALIGNNLVGADSQQLKLSNQPGQIRDGSYPYPLYTAVRYITYNDSYQWFEFSPYDVRNLASNIYVKSWAFGRKYIKNGTKFDSVSETLIHGTAFPAELPFNSLMGICGSAFTVNTQEIINDMESSGAKLSLVQQTVLNLVASKVPTDIKQARALSSQVFNFTPYEKDTMTLVDAGVDFNLPFPPLLQKDREIDLIIALDASATLSTGQALKGAEQYATTNFKLNNILKLPTIKYDGIATNPISVFKNDNGPTVIYVPFRFITDCGDSYCSTFNFGYKADQFNNIVKWIQSNVPFDQIRDIIASEQNKKNTK